VTNKVCKYSKSFKSSALVNSNCMPSGRYTAENSVNHGAPRNTDHPELRQPLALEVWQSVSRAVNSSDKITVLTNGPLTNLANIILSDKNATSFIQVSDLLL